MDERPELAAAAALHEPQRGRVYAYVVAQPDAVGRDEAAAALGVARSVAAFHLDKLAEVGLLEVEFRRPPGRSGPGAGRPAKLYRRARGEMSIHLPDRRYELAGRLLAAAVARAEQTGAAPAAAARDQAREHGRQVGASAPRRAGRGRAAALEAVAAALGEEGYEPLVEDGSVVLRNCPFHAVAEEQRELVCGMNVELVQGMIEGMRAKGLSARLDPQPGRCCVRVSCQTGGG
ncbi:MAG TPA: helix-turn-helix domain-containing protein [Acidimicrobiales bacterium]|nr:helix-turn-helix domain-containing protein [Acidimicrobiales bacterium]